VRFPESKSQESNDDGDPVKVVREHGTVGGGVGPSEQGVENAPSAAAVQLGVAALLGRGSVIFRGEGRMGGWRLTSTCQTLFRIS
jgi:hypothetical protein